MDEEGVLCMYIHTHIYTHNIIYAYKYNGILLLQKMKYCYFAMLVDLEGIMLSKQSQSEKAKYYE